MRALILGPTVALGLGFAVADTAVAQTGPTCTPTSLDSSALQAGSVTVSPVPGSRDASPQTQISFLGVPKGKLSGVSVVGSSTGTHSGRFTGYSEGNGASFVPARSFAAGERVTVRAQVRIGTTKHSLTDTFTVATPDHITETSTKTVAGSSSTYQHFLSRPDLQPPVVTVTATSPLSAPGDIFIAPYAGPGQPGPMIIDANGGLLWFKPLPHNVASTDLRVQEYLGKPVLTWWQGTDSVHGFGIGEGVIADSTYTDIAHVRAGNGQRVDLHELQLLPDGAALVTAYDPIRCNLSSAGGPHNSAVVNTVLQEIDVKTGLVMYEWSALDHVALSESYVRATFTSVPEPWDYFHLNSINVDSDGTLLISARNTWAAYKLDASTGKVLWRLGGKHSSFAGASNTRTAWQHDPRELPDGTITIFDNGAAPKVHSQSRGLQLSLDQKGHKVALIKELAHVPGLVSESEGNVQAMSNGNFFIGWGQLAQFSEFSNTGALLFDAHLPTYDRSYRDLRFNWSGTPAHPPVYAFRAAITGGGTVYASWNGATLVAAWRVLAGATATALTPVAEAPRSAFETAIALPPTTAGQYLQVQALDASGNVIGTSAATAQPTLKAAS